ncbi:ChaB family protein [Arthrobacter sp. Sa2CUA1]|uniref:ChaB family protein n=1 Tax=Arthrobacter gallicola TaxID=2762225 RepID=A0ABR8UQ61_9MICC|nr:ChaB family protein [Arthrobacter gallicola]MBD7994700.1 ChaB family protein [Arthrobacter gallicola]
MPKTTGSGSARKNELPSTLQRSDQKAQDTFAKTYDSALDEYGDEQRAAQTAYASLKRTHEKVGDHWEAKDSSGPSDQKAAEGRKSSAQTAGGVDANATKDHLYEVAARLDISGRSSMTKEELVTAIQKANEKKTRESREK